MSLSDAEQKQLVKDFHVLDLDTEVVGRSRIEFFMAGAEALASMRPSAEGLIEALEDCILRLGDYVPRRGAARDALDYANEVLANYRKGGA